MAGVSMGSTFCGGAGFYSRHRDGLTRPGPPPQTPPPSLCTFNSFFY
ncbi:unnamed protein product [Spirodela intermedia]|uniref:Uncharacterized protein n=1 Tax=Spirodela intermedia TaxID=51605 RepID=A0A7I8KAP7_SPIIN|nr:unnamed protein product [Spirodela intermedia]